MKKADANIKVKAVVTKVLSHNTEIIHDGGFHRTMERIAWRERRDMMMDMRSRGRTGSSRYDSMRFESVDDALPQRDWYEETTERVMVRYVVRGHMYEREVIVTDDGTWSLEGEKVCLTIDPSRPEEPLHVSRQETSNFTDKLLIIGVLFILCIILCIIAFLITLPFLLVSKKFFNMF